MHTPDTQWLDGVRRRQWREMVHNLPIQFAAMVIVGVTFYVAARGAVSNSALAVWFACFTLSSLSLPWLYFAFRNLNRWHQGWHHLVRIYMVCIISQGLVWGLGLAAILPDEPKLLLFALVQILSLLAGAPLVLSLHFPSLAIFATALVLPLGLRFMASNDSQIFVIGLASVPCLLFYYHAARVQSQQRLAALEALERDAFLVRTLEKEKSGINEALAQAQTANEAKSRFLAGASHDLRQPLQAIGLLVHALAQDSSPEERRTVVAKLSNSVDRLDRLFDRLLDISRYDAGKVQVMPVWTQTQDILTSLEHQFEGIAKKRGLRLRFRDVAHRMVYADPDLLEQLLGNLISNALRYTQRGTVLVGARRRGGQLVFQVWDTGLGIEPARHQDIFEEFVQLDNPLHAQTRGLGLGLAISRRISALLPAQLKVFSKPGRGSVFEVVLQAGVLLPLLNADEPHLPQDTRVNAADRSNTHPLHASNQAGAAPNELAGVYALVVDDEPDILQGFKHSLGNSGCYVQTASTLAQTQTWLDSTERLPDVLIVDYRLALGETAWDIIEPVQRACEGVLAVIIITGEINTALDAKAAALGIPVLRKPVSLTVLEAQLVRSIQSVNRQLEPASSE